MRIDEVIQQPGMKERMLKADIMKSLHVAVPGEVLTYDHATRTATIQPVIRGWNEKDDPPILTDVPVFFWGNFTFTPEKGTGCLVVCADSCIDSWVQNGGISTPLAARVHSLSDGFAFVGFRQTGGSDLPSILNNKKDKQTPVTDPVSSGDAIDFLASITQDKQGVLSATKKSVRAVAKGYSGLCPALPNEETVTKFLRQDGTWAVPAGTSYSAGTGLDLNNGVFSLAISGASAGSYGPSADVTGNEGQTISVPYVTVDQYGRITGISNKTYTSKNTTYSEASSSDYGLVKIGFAQANKDYPVQLSSGKMFVNVPWTDTTYSEATANDYGLLKIGYTQSGTKSPVVFDETTRQAYVDTRPYMQDVQYEYSYAKIGSGSSLNITATDFGASTPAGYSVVGIVQVWSGASGLAVCGFNAGATGATNMLRLRSVSSSEISSGTAQVTIRYIRIS